MTSITTPLGEVIRDDEGLRLEFVRNFPDPVDRVWAAVTDPDELAAWFGTWRGEPATGSVELKFVEGDDWGTVEIVECDAPHRLAVVVPSPDGPWPLTVTLTPDGEGTRLVFVHRLAKPYDATSVGPGWHYYLDRLAAAIAGAAVPGADEWPDYEPLGGRYPLPD